MSNNFWTTFAFSSALINLPTLMMWHYLASKSEHWNHLKYCESTRWGPALLSRRKKCKLRQLSSGITIAAQTV